jgi:putative hydrolase of the HAD superfamily
MAQIILFDVDGVLIHGYHAREELRHYWDENIEKDLGVNREGFCALFTTPLWNEIVSGRKDLFMGLSEYLPQCGYHDDPQIVIDYWLKNDSNINHNLIEKI